MDYTFLGTTKTRNITLGSTAVAVKADAGRLFAYNITNRHSASIFVKFYDIAAASVNPASSLPVLTVQVAANSFRDFRSYDLSIPFGTAISMRCVTEATDTGTTAAATLPVIELETL